MSDQVTWLPTSQFRPAEFAKLGVLELFTPFYGARTRCTFIGGVVGELPVVVMIDGQYAFEADPPSKWNDVSSEGWVINGLRFEVDRESISSVYPPRRGRLIISKSGAVFLGAVMNGQLQPVRIDSPHYEEVQQNDLAFSRWRIVCGHEDEPVELFAYTETTLKTAS